MQSYEEHPDQIAELLAFKANFHNYSSNNSVLIRKANPAATFVASFDRWKELGYAVKRGQRGIKILIPRTSTLFRTLSGESGEPVTKRLRDATPEEKAKIRAGEIRTYQRTSFSTGTVFDISQTTCPSEDYPKFYHMGYASGQHAALADAVEAYAVAQGILVVTKDLTSISLRGYYDPSRNTIALSDKLNDTERLSTLTHELGHAVMYAAGGGQEHASPVEIRELEADAVSIMLQTGFGLPLTQKRIDHLHNAYNACRQRDGFSFESFLKDVDRIYSQLSVQLQPHIETALQEFEKEKQKRREEQAAAAETAGTEEAQSLAPAAAGTPAMAAAIISETARKDTQNPRAEESHMGDFLSAIQDGQAAAIAKETEFSIDGIKETTYRIIKIKEDRDLGVYEGEPFPDASYIFSSAEKAFLFAQENHLTAVPESSFIHELERHVPDIVKVAQKMGFTPTVEVTHGTYAYTIPLFGEPYMLTFNNIGTDGGDVENTGNFVREFSAYAKEHFGTAFPDNIHTDDGTSAIAWLQKNFPGKFADLKVEDLTENFDDGYDIEAEIDAAIQSAASDYSSGAAVEPTEAPSPPPFAQQVDAALQATGAGRTDRQNALYVCDTPKVLTDLGLRQLPMLLTQKHLKDIVHPKDPANVHYHGLSAGQIKRLPHMLEAPAMVARSLTHADDLIVITAQTDPDKLPVMVSVRPDGQGRYDLERIDSNFITSVYGRTNFLSIDENGDLSPNCFLGRVMQAGGLLYQDKEKSQQLARDAGLQLPRGLTSAGSLSPESKAPGGSIVYDSITQIPGSVNAAAPVPQSRQEEKSSPAAPGAPVPPKQRLFVDMDGTLAKFIDQTDTPGALLEPGYFESLPPQQNVVEAIKQLTKAPALEVYVLSAALDLPNAVPEKNAWLDAHLPEIDLEHRLFPAHNQLKSMFTPGGLRHSDILLDDYSRNLHDWVQAGGIGIKLLNGINNNHGTWTKSQNPLEGAAVSYAGSPEEMIRHMLRDAEQKAAIMEQQQYQERLKIQKARENDTRRREEIDYIKQRINILDLAADIGYHVVKNGTHHSLEEHDSVVFYESNNTFTRFSTAQQNADGRPTGGSTIDFVLHFNEADGLGLPVHTSGDAIRYLKERYLGPDMPMPARQRISPAVLEAQQSATPKPFRLPDMFRPEEGGRPHMFPYLCKTRAIDPQILDSCQKRGLLYEDIAHNAVFVGKDMDGKPVYATRHTTLSNSKWKRDVAGSDQTAGWYVDNQADTLYVTEAPIDALSVMTLRKQAGKDPDDVNYLATTGTGKLNVLARKLKENAGVKRVVLAFDNDNAGQLATSQAAKLIRRDAPAAEITCYKIPSGKDVNEYLQNKSRGHEKDNGPERQKQQKQRAISAPAIEPR